jgi:hypothetical protein
MGGGKDQKQVAVCCTGPISGGAGSVLAWMMQALALEYRVDLISFQRPDMVSLDCYYGTSLESLEIVHVKPIRNRWLSSLVVSKCPSTLKRHLLMRILKRWNLNHYDLVFADFEADINHHVIQYIYYPLYSEGAESTYLSGGFPDSKWRRFYRRKLAWWSGFSLEAVRENPMIADSEYAATVCRSVYNRDDVGVIYPPVNVVFPSVPWSEREDAFITISRFVPVKRLEDTISIVGGIRKRMQRDLSLHIVAGGTHNSGYRHRILMMAKPRHWVRVHENIERDELNNLTANCRYGIHTMHGEHFGIAVAEMLLAGCLPFVFNQGGPVEIIGNIDSLQFRSVDEAVEKAMTVIGDLQAQLRLLQHLKVRQALFSADSFCRKICQLADDSISC